MALIKEYMTNKGPANYWVVSLIQIDNFNKTAFVKLYGFYNKEQADKQNPVSMITLEANITPELFDYYFDKSIMILPDVTPQTQAYQIFKDFNIQNEQGEIYNFSDAVDEIIEPIEGVQ